MKNPKKGLNLKILMSENPDYSEVVDSIGDAFEAGIILESSLKDGFQYTDLFAALEAQPKVQEIVNDIPEFVKQIVQINKVNPSLVINAVLEARQRILNSGRTFGKVTNAIMGGLFVAANNYAFVAQTYKAGQNQYLMLETLFNGGDVLPEPTAIA